MLRFFDWFLGLFGYRRQEGSAALPSLIPGAAVTFTPEDPSPDEVADLIEALAQDQEMLEWYDSEGWRLLKETRQESDQYRDHFVIETDDGKRWKAYPRWRKTDWVYTKPMRGSHARPHPHLKAGAVPRAVEMRCLNSKRADWNLEYLSRSRFIATYGFDPLARYQERIRKQRAALEAKRVHQEILESGDPARIKAEITRLNREIQRLRRG